MKNLLTFILLTVLFVNNGCGQTSPKQIVATFQTPINWTSKLSVDTSYFPLFERKQVAIWAFTNKSDSTIQETFYVFNYSPKDSIFLIERSIKYITLSSCFITNSNKPNENFSSFHRGNFYFLMKMCPCSKIDNAKCRQLANKLFEWTSQKM